MYDRGKKTQKTQNTPLSPAFLGSLALFMSWRYVILLYFKVAIKSYVNW